MSHPIYLNIFEFLESKKVEKEDQPPVDKVYVPADLEVPEIPKEEPKLVEFVDDLLMKHGSEKEDRVPPFPTVHLRFKEFGINERAFVKQMSVGFIYTTVNFVAILGFH